MTRMSLYSSFFPSDSRPEQDRNLTDTLARDDAGHPQATHAHHAKSRSRTVGLWYQLPSSHTSSQDFH